MKIFCCCCMDHQDLIQVEDEKVRCIVCGQWCQCYGCIVEAENQLSEQSEQKA